ncbi:Cbb3-type cytochrome c oxidase subunit CcoP [Aliiroseovarius sp. xm-m-379]|uniref:cytochrome-c oxidase, cbb3-type subunit III n=1 Tax=Aliiroseovarius TaxID=1658781 RepID=UPI00156A1338|nr:MULTISPECIES: cytochrome-c oxidase, cbb3-type subunit III [Aliiroseovarius]NRP14167.1 Cbb3-type cytochrome c oxidase subunit CcoP [Aliiroseovarius sp. xm-d-517]NRP23651.1 Cbb3-type cytochrome c oxidase subunit CcoP [Aliiroseovarius sp. xm-m-379]NRP29102.1 Cbb3-type cytochrome c oxidase subunit CcoP [Aliiroseovarius sp. xm-m-314]NRP32450.1 Cbb3-type cytochrome c oxidase subunit CcoP [Aliiroseovarius sp. xm-a-104]NRP40983.1 Cbb3-type cytochrome c oxidase subunit CcoP [Aliiroseovarius sp. xm-m
MSKKPVEKKEIETTGHEWDGIQEFNNPLPRWWVWIFYVTIVWGVWYTIAYPAWPLIKGATAGYLGYSTRGEVAAEIQRFDEMNASINAELAAADLTEIQPGTELYNYASQSGRATFATWCSQCHGAGADGAVGYPNLLDDDWLWGGDIEAIHTTIQHGIRDASNDDTRLNDMPAHDELLEAEEITQVVDYVLSLSGGEADAANVEAGAVVFEDNCSSCHAEGGVGDRDMGGPNLTDFIWLYGGDKETITESVAKGRTGVMPAWSAKLTDAQIKGVAVYVHQLGGGE